METQSSVRQAGKTPRVLKSPRVGLSPTMLLNIAGTRPDPAVSVPNANVTYIEVKALLKQEISNAPLVLELSHNLFKHLSNVLLTAIQ